MTGTAPFGDGQMHAHVATAPEPTLTITGATAVISGVRFVWSGLYCSWCRRTVHLWTDGGTIDAGLRPGLGKRRPGWFHIYRPASAPPVPAACPHPACPRPFESPAATVNSAG